MPSSTEIRFVAQSRASDVGCHVPEVRPTLEPVEVTPPCSLATRRCVRWFFLFCLPLERQGTHGLSGFRRLPHLACGAGARNPKKHHPIRGATVAPSNDGNTLLTEFSVRIRWLPDSSHDPVSARRLQRLGINVALIERKKRVFDRWFENPPSNGPGVCRGTWVASPHRFFEVSFSNSDQLFGQFLRRGFCSSFAWRALSALECHQNRPKNDVAGRRRGNDRSLSGWTAR